MNILDLKKELKYKIFIKSEKLYNLNLVNKEINKMRLYIYLIPQKIKSEYVDINSSFIEFRSFVNEYIMNINNLRNYLKDIKYIFNSLNINYKRHRQYIEFNRYKKERRVRFKYNQTDLFEKK